jgi:ABC-type nitrate/sulfonate/bicarbonate transport system substrate-binding protein
MRRIIAFILMAAFISVIPSGVGAASEKVTLGYLRGASGAPVEVMRSQKLGDRYGVEIDYKLFLDVAAMDRALVFGEHDVSLNISLNTWANYLNRGNDIVGVIGTLYPP